MIQTIYLIHQLSGVCVLYKSYGTISFNEDLIAGFLTALKDFSQEVTQGKGSIKVLDMVIYNIHLIFRKGMLIAAASDKRDDKTLVSNSLESLLNEFFKRYEDEIPNWSGDIRIFKNFDQYIDEVLDYGKVAEMPVEYPLLKLFKKDYKKEVKKLKKGIEVKDAELGSLDEEEALALRKDLKWKSKRLPKTVIKQGYLTEKEYEVAHTCDGFHSLEEIAELANLPESKIQSIVEKLDKLDMIDMISA